MIINKYIVPVMMICIFILTASPFFTSTDIMAADEYPWNDIHSNPYDFFFGNEFDTHQQTKENQRGELQGFLYITFTGETIGRIPVAEHCDGNTPDEDCEAGWFIRGKPGSATFVYHDNDHPIWLVSTRAHIPQPGSYTHFHWTGPPNGADGLTAGTTYDGYFIELDAIDRFYFSHHDEKVLVVPGIDNSTHVNVVGSFPAR